jgi:hypothetical protein
MIDDIDYLRDNSEKDTALIFVDSKKRDYATYPTPSHYSMSFEQSFKNVFSVEIVDASIPTTMYGVDIYNNYLWLTLVGRPKESTSDLVAFITELADCQFFINKFKLPEEYFFAVCDESHLEGIPIENPDLSNYVIAIKNSIENSSIILHTNETESDFYIFSYKMVDYAIKKIPANESIISIIKTKNFYIQGNNIIYYTFQYTSKQTYEIIIDGDLFWVNVINYRIQFPIGNYNASDFRSELNKILNNTLNIFVESLGGQDNRQSKYKFYSNSSLILIDGSVGSLDFILGYDLYPKNTDEDLYVPFKVGDNSHVFMAKYVTREQAWALVSPGILNLSGERFLILRCPEIEGHLYGSHAYVSNTTGIGMFKLAAAQNEITNLRWDFSTLIRKPIHPIGKLSKVTFRFELPNGNLYDFKGVNHQFMLAIKFYVPSQKRMFNKSILNPNYNPNLVEYITKEKGIKAKEMSDNEEDVDDDETYNYYRKQLEEEEEDDDSE